MPEVSIIIRTKNEERWITSCLDLIYQQTYKDFEIILVDNYSNDKTIKKAKKFNIQKILKLKKYSPGKSLNLGIKHSNGKYLVFISAHCLPTNDRWLHHLIKTIKQNNKFAGVYGRQEPMSFSSDKDKRDLSLVFGLDKKIQIKDNFFHNANSIISKKVWIKIKFDEKVNNIEDRIWAQEALSMGYKLCYQPLSSVYHYHGIHQNDNHERLSGVIQVIESRDKKYKAGRLDANKIEIAALIPVKGNSQKINETPLVAYTIRKAINSKFINKVIVSTDNLQTKKIAIKEGAECPFLRPKKYSKPYINLEQVQKYSLNQLEKNNYYPDLIFHLEETFPFRNEKLIDSMIINFLKEGYDTLIAVKEESGWLWKENIKNQFTRIDEGDIPREFKLKTYIGLHGLACLTHSEFVRKGSLLGKKIGFFKVKDNISSFEVRDQNSIDITSKILK